MNALIKATALFGKREEDTFAIVLGRNKNGGSKAT